MTRTCGSCTLCCKLLPVAEGHEPRAMVAMFGVPGMLQNFDKPAGQRCKHQRHTGCNVYDKRPLACRLWSCRWLSNDDTADLSRPDRAGYVIDMAPDYVRLDKHDGKPPEPIPVVQIWCDPKRKEDWYKDEALLKYIERRAAEGTLAMVRFGSHEAVTVVAPNAASDRQWHVVGGQMEARPIHDR